MDYLIGLDIGTSQVKAVLFDMDGHELAVCSEPTEVATWSNCSEQDMMQVWAKSAACLKNLTQHQNIDPSRILAVGLSGQGEGLWLADSNGEPVQPAILWSDGRAADTVSLLPDSTIRRFTEITYGKALPGGTMILLKWMTDHYPERLEAAAACYNCKDWVRYNLTGTSHTEYTDSSVTMLDFAQQEYAEELMTLLGIAEFRRLFPSLVRADEPAGYVTQSASKMTGLKVGTPVSGGGLDVAVTALGIAAVNPGDIFLILGTTACIGIVLDLKDADSTKGRFISHPRSGLAIQIMATMAGTPNIDWVTGNISLSQDFTNIENEIRHVQPGCGGVIYHPYIGVAGERAPFYHPYAKAGFFGISATTTRSELIRAVYEGVAFSVKDCLHDTSAKGHIHIAGGGSRSATWAQIIADVCGREVISHVGSEFGAKGAAILAYRCIHPEIPIEDIASHYCPEHDRWAPDERNHALYAAYFHLYRRIRMVSDDLWTERHRILTLSYQ